MDDLTLSLVKENGVASEVKGTEIKKAVRKEYTQDEVEAIILNYLEHEIEKSDTATSEAHVQELKELIEYRKSVKASVKTTLGLAEEETDNE